MGNEVKNGEMLTREMRIRKKKLIKWIFRYKMIGEILISEHGNEDIKVCRGE